MKEPQNPAAEEGPEYVANLRRATLASTVGSALEYFDFALYGLASALIFNRLFFSSLDPAMGVVASLATFGVGFVARPLGGLFFGTLGDRIGRKWVLVVTILLMGGSTTLIGALPTYESIGIWAPILLTILRLAQGFGAGAEQAGATVLMAEYSPVRRRGFLSSLPFIGIQLGTLMASVVYAALSALPDEIFVEWAWRVPFLCSFALILLALFIRARLKETPTYVELEKNEDVAERPLRQVFTDGLPGVVAGIGLRMAENGSSYMMQTLALSFATGTAAATVDQSQATWGITLGALIGIAVIPITGRLSDRIGRRPVYRAGSLFLLTFSFPAWWLLQTGSPLAVIATVAIGYGVGVNTMLGPQCAMLPELFGNRHRYLGVAMARELSAVLAGGLAGVVGAWMLAISDGNWLLPAIYMATLAAITTATTVLTPETRGRDLLRVEDAVRVSDDEQDPLLAASAPSRPVIDPPPETAAEEARDERVEHTI